MNDFIDYDCVHDQKSVVFENDQLRPHFLVSNPMPNMPLIDAICTRRTARVYGKDKVPFELFKWIVNISLNSPSACNEQNWKIIYIDDCDIISELYYRGSASFIKNVKQCFLVCYNNSEDNKEWSDDIQSGASFINTFSLLAHSVGVGTCWIGHLPNKSELQRMFGIHKQYKPVALVSFGYYKSGVKMKPRKKTVDDVVFINRFDSSRLVFKEKKTRLRRYMRYFYYKIPFFIRKNLKKYASRYEKKFYYENFD
jgi:albonoursin synthase